MPYDVQLAMARAYDVRSAFARECFSYFTFLWLLLSVVFVRHLCLDIVQSIYLDQKR